MQSSPSTGWKTDFRQIGSLPDTKAVRTSFYVNIGAAGILAASLIYVAINESSISDKETELQALTSDASRMQPTNTDITNKDKQFSAQKARLLDIENFINTQGMDPLNFIQSVAESLPPQVILENIEQKASIGKITGYVKSSAEVATGIVYNLEQALNKHATLAKNFSSISISNVVKDSQNERLNFEITFSNPKPVAGKK